MAELKIKKSTAGSAPTTLEERTLGIHGDNLYFGSSTGTAIKLAKSTDIPSTYAGSSSAGGAADYALKMQTYYDGDTNKTYGTSYPVFMQWEGSVGVWKVTGYDTAVNMLMDRHTDTGLAVGDTNTPVYFANGKPTICTLNNYMPKSGGSFTGPVNFSSTTPSTFKVHPTSENGLPLGVVDISNITAVNTTPAIDTSTAHEMPIIRMGPVLFSSTDGSISNEYPLTLKVEVIGGTLREGDELQLCGMKLYTWREGTIRKYKMRQFITRTITADDIGKRYLTIQVTGEKSRDLLSGGWYPYSQTPNPTSRTRHPKYLRIRRIDPDNTDNAFFSNAVSFYAYGAYDKDNLSSKGRVSIR